jgi:homoserine kinase
MPASAHAIERLRAAGVAAYLSGAGPSVGCLLVESTEAAFDEIAAALDGFEILRCDWDLAGARIVER